MNKLFIARHLSEDISCLAIDRNTKLYFIVEHTDNKKFISDLANKLLDTSCRWFHFYGKYEGLYDRSFVNIDIERGYSDDNVAVTSSLYDLEDFVRSVLVASKIDKHKVVVLYDDTNLYNQFIKEIKKSNKIK